MERRNYRINKYNENEIKQKVGKERKKGGQEGRKPGRMGQINK
jgi:hypothetical protein